MITIVKAEVNFFYDGDINDFLGLIDLYDGSKSGVFGQEPMAAKITIKEITQDASLDEKDFEETDENDKIWFKED